MNNPTVRFVFDRKKQATLSKKGLVQLEVSSDRQRKWIGTGVKLYSNQWDDRLMVINSPDLVMQNSLLLKQKQRIINWLSMLIEKGESFDFIKLDRFLSSVKTSENFLDFLEDQIYRRQDIRKSTRKSHSKLIRSLKQFGKIIYFSDLTKRNILEYDSWLHNHDYVQATIHSYHKYLKIYINVALRSELINNNPYNGVKIDRGRSKSRKYLTEAEVNAIEKAAVINKKLEIARDLFLFQCYTGFAYAELASFDASKITERNNKYVIHDSRLKTDEQYYTVLLSPALDILRKYNFHLPVIGLHQYNLQLKVLASLAGVDKSLTSHMGRHTFAVFALNHGASIENVSKMMGHSDIKTTQLYAKVLNTAVEREFDKLEKFICDRNK